MKTGDSCETDQLTVN